MPKREFPTHILALLLILLASIMVISQDADYLPNAETPPPPAESPVDDGTDSDTEKSLEGRSYRLERGEKEWTFIPSFAPMQPLFLSGNKEYDTAGRKFGMLNIQFARTIGTKGPVTYQYFFEFTPLVVALNNEVRNPRFVSNVVTPAEPSTVRKTAYGAGFQPANFRFLFRPNKRIKPFAQIGAGMMFFNQNMPVPESTNYNFTGDFGGGLHIMTNNEPKNRRALTLGYRYFHISNFNTSTFNPGYNASTFYIGYSFLQ